MKHYSFLTLAVIFISCATGLARDYDITKGSITFTRANNGSDLHVVQGSTNDTYYNYSTTLSNILIYGTSTITANTIEINTPSYESDGQILITLSNVLIQSSSAIPMKLTYYSPVDLFLAPGTSNELKTTGIGCPGIRVASDSDGTAKVRIKGSGKLVVTGGESSAGIGGDSYANGGIIQIEDNVKVLATGGMGGAGIGGGEASGGGTITISSNAFVFAQGGIGGGPDYDGDTVGSASGIGGGGSSTYDNGFTVSAPGTISISSNTQVVAVSEGTLPAIWDDGATLDGNGFVLHATYFSTQPAGTTNAIKSQAKVTLISATPSIAYKSIAFSLSKTNAYLVYCNGNQQEHQSNKNFTLLTTGMTFFTDLTTINKVVVTFDKTGGSGGSNQVVAAYNVAMPFATGPTNSNTYLSFGGYFLDDGTTKYYNADMSSARSCNILADFTLYAKWIDGRSWDGVSKTYDWYTNKASPYTISAAAQLAGFAAIVNGTAGSIPNDTFSNKIVRLAQDINLTNYQWTAIGNFATSSNLFKGTFDGGTKTISGVKITTNRNYQGLFGYIVTNSIISNLTVGASISASNYVGAIAGYNNGGTIQNCTATGTITATNYVGGIAGTMSAGFVRNCSYSGIVTGTRSNTYAGGIIGENSGILQNAIAFSNVTAMGSSARIGGIVGYNSGLIMNGLMLGSLTVDATTAKGGIAGENTSSGSITNSYFLTGASVSNAIGTAAGAYTSVGSFSNTTGFVTAKNGTSLIYGTQLHIALNKWVYTNNISGTLDWWTTDTAFYPSFTTTRPPFTFSTPQLVPFDWLATYYPADPEANYETRAHSVGSNGLDVWESYVAVLNPTDETSTFIASITLTNGTPYVSWSPNYSNRVYTVQGKSQLGDGWGSTNNARFFKVTVEKP